jgi:hypothetical protein
MIQTLYAEDKMLALVPWLVFLHILSAITFFLAHGASVAMAFKIRSESDFRRIGALLDLSALKKIKATDLVIVGYVIPVIVLWLMVFKPF